MKQHRVSMWGEPIDGLVQGFPQAAAWCARHGIGTKLHVQAVRLLNRKWLSDPVTRFMQERADDIYGVATNRQCVEWCARKAVPLVVCVSHFRPGSPGGRVGYNDEAFRVTDAEFALACSLAEREALRLHVLDDRLVIQIENEPFAGNAAYELDEYDDRWMAAVDAVDEAEVLIRDVTTSTRITEGRHFAIPDAFSLEQVAQGVTQRRRGTNGPRFALDEFWLARGREDSERSAAQYRTALAQAEREGSIVTGFFVGHEGQSAGLRWGAATYYTTAWGDGAMTAIGRALDELFQHETPVPIVPTPQPKPDVHTRTKIARALDAIESLLVRRQSAKMPKRDKWEETSFLRDGDLGSLRVSIETVRGWLASVSNRPSQAETRQALRELESMRHEIESRVGKVPNRKKRKSTAALRSGDVDDVIETLEDLELLIASLTFADDKPAPPTPLPPGRPDDQLPSDGGAQFSEDDLAAVSMLMQDERVHLACLRRRNHWEIRHRNTEGGEPSAPIREATISAAYSRYKRERFGVTLTRPPHQLSRDEVAALAALWNVPLDNPRAVRWERDYTEVDYIDRDGEHAGGASDSARWGRGELVEPVKHLVRALS